MLIYRAERMNYVGMMAMHVPRVRAMYLCCRLQVQLSWRVTRDDMHPLTIIFAIIIIKRALPVCLAIWCTGQPGVCPDRKEHICLCSLGGLLCCTLSCHLGSLYSHTCYLINYTSFPINFTAHNPVPS